MDAGPPLVTTTPPSGECPRCLPGSGKPVGHPGRHVLGGMATAAAPVVMGEEAEGDGADRDRAAPQGGAGGAPQVPQVGWQVQVRFTQGSLPGWYGGTIESIDRRWPEDEAAAAVEQEQMREQGQEQEAAASAAAAAAAAVEGGEERGDGGGGDGGASERAPFVATLAVRYEDGIVDRVPFPHPHNEVRVIPPHASLPRQDAAAREQATADACPKCLPGAGKVAGHLDRHVARPAVKAAVGVDRRPEAAGAEEAAKAAVGDRGSVWFGEPPESRGW